MFQQEGHTIFQPKARLAIKPGAKIGTGSQRSYTELAFCKKIPNSNVVYDLDTDLPRVHFNAPYLSILNFCFQKSFVTNFTKIKINLPEFKVVIGLALIS